jgi:hypothetical protein
VAVVDVPVLPLGVVVVVPDVLPEVPAVLVPPAVVVDVPVVV